MTQTRTDGFIGSLIGQWLLWWMGLKSAPCLSDFQYLSGGSAKVETGESKAQISTKRIVHKEQNGGALGCPSRPRPRETPWCPFSLAQEHRDRLAERRWSPRGQDVFPRLYEHQVTEDKDEDGREGKKGRVRRTKGHDPCGTSKLSYDGSRGKYKMFKI